MAFTVPFGHGVACRLEDHAANCGRRHCQKYNGRRIISDGVIHPAHGPGCHEIVRQPECKKIESACRKNQEARKYQKMKNARDSVPRMFPLPKPEFHDMAHSQPGPVKPEIAFATSQRREPSGYDVCEAG